MPTYTHKCKKCDSTQEEFYHLDDQPWIRCGECGGVTERLFPAPMGFMKTRTLGSLADQNRSKMSNDEAEKKTEEIITKKTEGGGELGPGMRRVKKQKREKGFGDKHKTKTVREITKMDSKQTKRYIENG